MPIWSLQKTPKKEGGGPKKKSSQLLPNQVSHEKVSPNWLKIFSGKIIAFLVPKKILNIIWALQRDLDEKIVFQPPAEIAL